MAEADKDIPKYMRLTAKTQYELAQNIDAAMTEAELSNDTGKSQVCFQICHEQLMDQLQEEYGLNLTEILPNRVTIDKHILKQDMLSMIGPCGAQYQLSHGAKGVLQNFQLGFEKIVQRSLQDALDIIKSKGIWRFDLQRSVQEIQTRVINKVKLYHFS